MIRYICDGCQEEITDLNQIGNFKIQEKTFTFVKHQKQDQVRGQEFIFCIDCSRKIRDNFKELKSDGGNKK